MQQSLQSIGASGCSAFEAVETAEWGYQGHPLLQEGDSSSSSSSGTSSVFPNRSLLSQLLHAVDDSSSSSSSSSRFLGIRVLQQSLKGIEGLLGGNSSSSSILDLIERFVEDGKVLKGDTIGLSETHEAFGYNVQQMKTAAEKHYMTSLFAAAVDTLRPDDTYTALLSAHEVFSETVDKAIQGVTLPELELSIDLDPLAAATSGVQLAASEAADVGAFAAVLGPLLLWAEVALLFLGIAFAVVALILFACTKGKGGRSCSSTAWVLLLLIAAVGLLFSGCLFIAYSLGAPVCSWGVQTLWGT